MMEFHSLPLRTLAFALLLLTAFSGCSDDPNATGVGFFQPINVGTVQTYATSDTSFAYRSGYSSLTILAGKSGDLEARSIVELYAPQILDTLQRIDSAVVTFWIRYHFGDSTGKYGLTANAMTRTWIDTSFRWDSVVNSYNPTPSGSVDAPGDSVIRIKLDTALVRSFARATGRKGSIMLIPQFGTALVLGFMNLYDPNAPDHRPELAICYHDTSDTTIAVRTRSTRGMFVGNTQFVPPANFLYLQAGISERAIIRFDSLSVPTQVAITQATLDLCLNESQSLTNYQTRDSLIVSLLRKNLAPYDSVALSLTCKPVIEGGQKKYRADLSAIVQQWTTREPNLGLLIRPLGESTTFDRFVLYDAAATTALRPKITITYTKLQR